MARSRLVDHRTNVLEKDIEKYLREQVQKAGGRAYKFMSPSHRSVPDRLCIFPGGHIYFIEVKKTGGKLTKTQELELELLRSFGFQAFTVWSKKDVDRRLTIIKEEIKVNKMVQSL